jgi:hypothetical protein
MIEGNGNAGANHGNSGVTFQLDEGALRRKLAPRLNDPRFRGGLANLASDPFFVAYFLMSVSQGEGLGEAAVGLIRQEELAALIHGLTRQEDEERGHKEGTRDAALELFPDLFDGDRYRYDAGLSGLPYYVTVLETNRVRLKQRDCYTRLSLYLTTTFGYEVMVVLLYDAVARAVATSTLPPKVRDRVVSVLRGILAEEETHLGVADQHAALEASAAAVA